MQPAVLAINAPNDWRRTGTFSLISIGFSPKFIELNDFFILQIDLRLCVRLCNHNQCVNVRYRAVNCMCTYTWVCIVYGYTVFFVFIVPIRDNLSQKACQFKFFSIPVLLLLFTIDDVETVLQKMSINCSYIEWFFEKSGIEINLPFTFCQFAKWLHKRCRHTHTLHFDEIAKVARSYQLNDVNSDVMILNVFLG